MRGVGGRLLGAVLVCGILWGAAGCGGSSSSGPKLTSLDIAPVSPMIAINGSVQFMGTAHFSDGSSADITHTGNWFSSNGTVATIKSTGTTPGLAHGVNLGKCEITVSFAQGPNIAMASTDLTVSNSSSNSSRDQLRGGAEIELRGEQGEVKLDGQDQRVQGVAAVRLAPGVHRVSSVDGRNAFMLHVEAGQRYALRVEGERISLEATGDGR